MPFIGIQRRRVGNILQVLLLYECLKCGQSARVELRPNFRIDDTPDKFDQTNLIPRYRNQGKTDTN